MRTASEEIMDYAKAIRFWAIRGENGREDKEFFQNALRLMMEKADMNGDMISGVAREEANRVLHM